MAKVKLPIILDHYLDNTGQFYYYGEYRELSESHLLNEAEWCLYNAMDNEASCAYEYSPQSKAALRRYVQRLRDRGIVPKRDFD